ncbi:MAG: histidine kinase [Myxococcota bacterium]|nr:histidine kinase [Myxococcota bacterium]
MRFPLPYWALRWRELVSVAGLLLVGGLAVTALVYTYHRLAVEVERREAQMAQLREAGLHARLSALQAQINPHFLFNALNSLAELVHGDPDEAERHVGDLAHLLRYSLRSSASGLVPLEHELVAVDRYLSLERVRLGDRLRVDVDVDPALGSTQVPGLSLQPLVENAVRHAVAARSEGGTLRVTAVAEEGGLRIAVEDDGPGLPDEVRARLAAVASAEPGAAPAPAGTGGAGGGLANVQQRMMLSYPGSGGLTVVEPEGGGTRLELFLPRDER